MMIYHPLLQYEPVVSQCIYDFLSLSSDGRQLLASSKQFHESYFSYLSAARTEVTPSDMVFLMSLRTRVLSLNSSQELCLITKSDLFIGASLTARIWKRFLYHIGYHDYLVDEAIERRCERETRTIGMLVTPKMWESFEPPRPLLEQMFMSEATALKRRADLRLNAASSLWDEWTAQGTHPGTFEEWQKEHLSHSLNRLGDVEHDTDKELKKRSIFIQPTKSWYPYVASSNEPSWKREHLLGILDHLDHLKAYTELSKQLNMQTPHHTYRVVRWAKFLEVLSVDLFIGFFHSMITWIKYISGIGPVPGPSELSRRFKRLLVTVIVGEILVTYFLGLLALWIYVMGVLIVTLRFTFTLVPERELVFKSAPYTNAFNPDHNTASSPPIKRLMQLRRDVTTRFDPQLAHPTPLDLALRTMTMREISLLIDFERL